VLNSPLLLIGVAAEAFALDVSHFLLSHNWLNNDHMTS